MTDRKQKIKSALVALEGALKYARHQYEYSEEPVTHGDLIAPILTAMITLCDLQNETTRDWTPCPDGRDLPEVDGEYNVMVLVSKGLLKETISTSATFDPNDDDGDWMLLNPPPRYDYWFVLAWQPLPAPYRADDTTGKVKEEKADD